MGKGGYLRTNWRKTGQVLTLDAIGAGIPKGSMLGGPGHTLLHGGLVFHKISAVGSNPAAAQGVYSIGADAVLNSVFEGGRFGAGWKIQPFAIWPQMLSGTAGGDTSILNMIWSLTLSDDSTIKFYAQIYSLTADNKASYFSAVWRWAGFIISSP